MTDSMNNTQDDMFDDYDAALTSRPVGNPRSVPELKKEIERIEKALKEVNADRDALLNMLSDAELEMDLRLEQEAWDLFQSQADSGTSAVNDAD